MEYFTSEGIIVTNRIFVGSIPDWMCENKLHLAFQDLNFNVQDTRIVVDMQTGQRKGYGFVTFYNANDAVELIRKGFVVTKNGVKLKIDTAVRKKGMQLRLQRQNKIYQNNMNIIAFNNGGYQSAQNNQVQALQIPTVGYQGSAMCDRSTNRPAMTYHPSYNYAWQSQATTMPCNHAIFW